METWVQRLRQVCTCPNGRTARRLCRRVTEKSQTWGRSERVCDLPGWLLCPQSHFLSIRPPNSGQSNCLKCESYHITFLFKILNWFLSTSRTTFRWLPVHFSQDCLAPSIPHPGHTEWIALLANQFVSLIWILCVAFPLSSCLYHKANLHITQSTFQIDQ